MTNVRTIAEDMAGNVSPAVSNNINAGTINGGAGVVGYAGAGIAAPGWLFTVPVANTEICNGEGDPDTEDCVDDLGAERSLDVEAEVTGASGTFANPFLNGRIYFYLVHPVTAENVLIGDISANSGALTDDGFVRTYAWEHTLEASDVTGFAPGVGALTVFAIGVNADGEGLQLADLVLDVVDGV